MRRSTRTLLAAIGVSLTLATSPAFAQITIGVAGPMTGTLAPIGVEERAGVEAAVAAINAAGGVLGQQVVVNVADDTADLAPCSNEERAQAVANQLAGAGAVLVVGHPCTVASIAAAPVYAAEGIIQIAPGAPDARFTDERAGAGAFRLFGRAEAQATTAAELIATRFAETPIAVIDDQTEYGRKLGGAIREALGSAGVVLGFNESYLPLSVDLPDLVRRITASGAGLVYFAGGASEAARLRLEMVAQGSTAIVFGGDALADPDFVEAAGTAADATLFTWPPDPRLAPQARAVVEAMRAAGIEPSGITLYAYAAVEIWAAAVAEVGTTDLGPVAAAIAEGTFDTVLGPITFDDVGAANIVGWEAFVWQGGAYAPFAPP